MKTSPLFTPQTLFKFMQSSHAENLLAHGELRIGTLSNYRTHFKGLIHDSMEGSIKTCHYHQIPYKISCSAPLSDCSPEWNLMVNEFMSKIYAPDFYIACFSKSFDESLFEDFNSDVCIEIIDVPSFIKTLNESLKDHGHLYAMDNCRYDKAVLEIKLFEPVISLDEFIFNKPPLHAKACEWRMVWRPFKHTKRLKPLIIRNQDLAKFCCISKKYQDIV